MRGRQFIIKYLHEFIASEMNRLGISTSGIAEVDKPIVYLEQFSSESVDGFKDCDTYNCSMLFDIASRSSSLTEAYNIADIIIQGIDFTTAPFGVNSYDFNTNNSNVELDDNGVIVMQRQPIRLELELTLKLE